MDKKNQKVLNLTIHSKETRLEQERGTGVEDRDGREKGEWREKKSGSNEFDIVALAKLPILLGT